MKSKKIISSTFIIALAVSLSFCKKEADKVVTTDDAPYVPVLPEQVDDYPVSNNDYLAALGRVLFYERELSANKNISCGSCHQQQRGFTDGMNLGIGTNSENTKRNTPQIFAHSGKVFWDGRGNSQQDMVLMPIKDSREMSINNMTMLIERLNSIDYYKPLLAHAFPGNQGELDSLRIKLAVGEFMRNFTFSNNKFNASVKGLAQLSTEEQQGKDLFFGSAGCANCHRLAPVANQYYGSLTQSHNIGLDLDNPDLGVGAITRQKKDEGAFMTPILMNVEYTAPYMHNGRFKTLEEVVEHYNSEVKPNPNLDPLLKTYSGPKKLNLNEAQKAALVAFLKTLSDPAVLSDKKYSDPFVVRGS